MFVEKYFYFSIVPHKKTVVIDTLIPKFNPTRLSDLNRMNIASKKAPSRDHHHHQSHVQPIASAGYSDYRKPVMNERNEGKFVC